ncbi:hypothetical protein CANCADRAFT_1061 [Tortispora caseinolytica NRRL Y-17796]|uniref:Mitochondrial chaperone BCS1 n=1 Tax=Tortispora caseinolytica NRRL Y-17796 TaxID=767744 RepID=A0A1E4TL62_9ASCO|nr:hypothetical protein CANCADRAFT_1061 [Tortispora caseinolytica NRRL Y-17796]
MAADEVDLASGTQALLSGSSDVRGLSVTELAEKLFASNPYFSAGFGLMGLGVGLAALRQISRRTASLLYKQLLVDLEIPSKDKSYMWFLDWMAKQNVADAQSANRGGFFGRRHLAVQTQYRQHDNGSVTTSFSLVPGPGTHIIRYKGAFIQVSRERSGRLMDLTSGTPFETVVLKTLYKDRHLFEDILNEAREIAVQKQEGKTVLFTSYGPEWRPFGQPRRRRPIESVVLDETVAESLIADIEEFLDNGKWYYDRGIPYRRGYLLYGPPGSGKSSFIQALAGHLDYNICILNLSEAHLTDDRLNHLMNHIPERSVLLLEDVDAAFSQRAQSTDQGYVSGVTFSGLLNALDGVTSSEERIIFMTTNHPERLDPALVRPGRVDVQKLIDYASPYQIRKMFARFYGDLATEKLADRLVDIATNLGRPLSTAELQGLFITFKSSPHTALEALEATKHNAGI